MADTFFSDGGGLRGYILMSGRDSQPIIERVLPHSEFRAVFTRERVWSGPLRFNTTAKQATLQEDELFDAWRLLSGSISVTRARVDRSYDAEQIRGRDDV